MQPFSISFFSFHKNVAITFGPMTLMIIGIWLIYNVGLASGAQQNESGPMF